MCSLNDLRPGPSTNSPEALALEHLEHEITELAAHIHAATCRWLYLVVEFDRRQGWATWGSSSCAHWLSWRCGLAPGAAREQLRVARRLDELPLVRGAFGRGELSFSKVRAVSRLACAKTEAALLELAQHALAAKLERLVRAYRTAAEGDELGRARNAHRERHLTWAWNDDGSLDVRGRLSAEEGAVFLEALAAGRDAARAEGVSAETPSGDSSEGPGARNADALGLMAETLLATGTSRRPGGERHELVVHVDAEALSGDDPEARSELEHGPALPPETARRLGCDASVIRILERDGRPLSVGRRTRAVPAALHRALRSRDGTCRFPGCNHRRFVDAHHIKHWAHGGETDLDNLLLLCSHHHRLVHEDGYTIEGRSRRGVVFRRPDGGAIPAVPRPATGDPGRVRERGRRAGVGPTACVARSVGDKLDYAMAVECLLLRAGRWG